MGKGLIKSTFVVSGATLISRVLGFARDMIFANLFGAGAGTDAFFVAFKIPNFLRRLFAEGAFSQAFVPVLAETRSRGDHTAVRDLIASTSGTLGVILLLITLLAILASDGLVYLFAPGFHGHADKFALAADMLQLTFPYLLFISLTALAGGVLNTYGRFAIPALTPVWLNIVLIASAFWGGIYLQLPIMALAWGVLIAGIVQLLFQLPLLYRLGLLVLPRFSWHHSGVRKILKLMLPAIFGSSVAQINLLLDTIIASFLVTGSVSWLYYSDRLVEFPLGLFAIAIATVILPNLSSRHAESDAEQFSKTLDWALRMVLLVGIPSALALFMLASPILTTLFQYGAFSEGDVAMSALSLQAYSLGLIGFMLVKILAPGFYARQDTKTPVRFGIYSMVANMGLNILFVVPMVIMGVEGPHAGLALATACSAFLNAVLLYRRLRRTGIYQLQPGWLLYSGRLLLASAFLALLLYIFTPAMSEWFAWGAGERLLQVLFLVSIGISGYFALLWLLGVRKEDFILLSSQQK